MLPVAYIASPGRYIHVKIYTKFFKKKALYEAILILIEPAFEVQEIVVHLV